MASKRRLRRKQCGSKRRYETQNEAKQAAHNARRRGVINGYVEPYRCKWCGKFHWGHSKRWSK